VLGKVCKPRCLIGANTSRCGGLTHGPAGIKSTPPTVWATRRRPTRPHRFESTNLQTALASKNTTGEASQLGLNHDDRIRVIACGDIAGNAITSRAVTWLHDRQWIALAH
jgi:hypothetical protein